uniref:Secreted protein n=1 Tax=Moniliophthora roreri TaxID=221103 RepID=A0A0W0FPS2_MONRR
MRYCRYFITLFLLVLPLTEVTLSASALAKVAVDISWSELLCAYLFRFKVTEEGDCKKQTTCEKSHDVFVISVLVASQVTVLQVKDANGTVRSSKKDSGDCVGLSTAIGKPDTSAKNIGECKELAATTKAHLDICSAKAPEVDPVIGDAAVKHFNSIAKHVFGTQKMKNSFSGKHKADVFEGFVN